MNVSLTVLVLSKGDVSLVGGVQDPEDGIHVGAVEQTWSRLTSLLRSLQLLQLLNQELPGIF